jgi:ribosomally synthesized peptide (two-chain TOMM family)
MAQIDFIQQLMDFRTTYVRAVARATVDLQFRKELTKEGGNPLSVLHEEFGYRCPWGLTLVLNDDPNRGPRVNPATGTVMTMPYWGESITVSIPKKPAGDAKVQMDALAAYYHENPWFLQPGRPNDADRASPRDVPRGIHNPSAPYQGKWTSVNADPDRNTRFDLGVNFEDFISFAAAIFNAVALSWDNEVFLGQLTAYKGEAETDRKKTITLLNEWLGYKYPWQLDLVVRTDEKATYNPAKRAWENTTPPVLMLTIPWMTGATGGDAAQAEVDTNKKNLGVAIVGVALYNTDGPGYPFTCG